jgi:hypothetical protein
MRDAACRGGHTQSRAVEAFGRALCASVSQEEIMYVTVRRYEGVTNAREVGREVEKTFLPLVSDIAGFVAYYWIDAGDGVMLSTSVFETKAGAEESNRRAAAVVRERLASMMPNPPRITAGEVVAHKAA